MENCFPDIVSMRILVCCITQALISGMILMKRDGSYMMVNVPICLMSLAVFRLIQNKQVGGMEDRPQKKSFIIRLVRW